MLKGLSDASVPVEAVVVLGPERAGYRFHFLVERLLWVVHHAELVRYKQSAVLLRRKRFMHHFLEVVVQDEAARGDILQTQDQLVTGTDVSGWKVYPGFPIGLPWVPVFSPVFVRFP